MDSAVTGSYVGTAVAGPSIARFTRLMEIREEVRAMSEVTRRLQEKFPGARPDVVDALVKGLRHEFDGNPIRDFVPVLVEREAVARLAPSAHPRSHAPV